MDQNNQYQDNQNQNNQGYNDTYYNNDYNNNSYNNTPQPNQGGNNNLLKIILIVVLIIIIGVAAFFIFGKGGNGEKEYAELTKKLCNAAIQYEKNHPEIIDTDTPGSTAYITLKKLSDSYLIDSVVKDPRKKGTTLPLTTYVRLAVASNGEVYCESVVDTGEDKTPPILTLNGEPEVTVLKGTNYTDPGAKAVDDTDGDLTSKITRSGSVDVNKRGDYTITYRVTDTSGNSTSKERKILVREYNELDPTAAANLDVTPPQIEVKGANPYCLELGKKYIEPGIIAVDNVDGVITNRVIVDNKATGERIGTFRVTYTVEDTAGNKAVAYRSVEVKSSCAAVVPPKDTTPVNTKPTISLIGGSSVIHNLNEQYIDRGANAWDKEDGDLTGYIRVDASAVNISSPGIYNVYYEVTDSDGARTTVKRLVTVANTNATTNPPIAHFLEYPSNIKIAVGNPIDISVPRAQDDSGTLLNVTVVTKGPAGDVIPVVDFYTVGLYTIIYSATPQGGVTQSVSRTVDVYDTAAPVLTAPSLITIQKRATNCSLTVDDLTKAGVRATDSSNSKLARIVIVSTNANICTTTTTAYEAKIQAVDDYGNKSDTKTIDIRVTEEAPPTEVTSVSVLDCGANKEIELTVGATKQLGVAVYPAEATNRTVTWSVEEPNPVVTIANGLVTANAKGSAHVKVRSNNGKEDVCYVIVKDAAQNIPVQSVSIEGCPGGSLTIDKGKWKTLTPAIVPANATNQAVTWTTADANKVVVNEGQIYGKSAGTAVITVTTKDGNKPATCNVTVNELTITDSTPPAKVTVVSNTANPADPYNTNGTWYGNKALGKGEIKLVVESSDPDSGICSFELVRAGNKTTEISPSTANPNRAEITFKEDINETVQIKAVNCGNLSGDLSNPVIVRLDNTGPVTTFSQAILSPNEWLSQPSYTTKYSATDSGYGIEGIKYEYAYSDVDVDKLDPTTLQVEAQTTLGEATFNENLIKNNIYVKYIYFRAIDKLGNVGEWTKTPMYLNLDTVAPLTPGITVKNNKTERVTVALTFTDGVSPKSSGLWKYTYKLDNGAVQDNTTGAIDLITAGQHKIEVWAHDRAKNVSATPAVKQGADLEVVPMLTVTCAKTSMVEDTSVTCSLSGAAANEVGVLLDCFPASNASTYYQKFTTTSTVKSITCKPTVAGDMTVKATKAGWTTGRTTVKVTAASTPSDPKPPTPSTPAPKIYSDSALKTICTTIQMKAAINSMVAIYSDIPVTWEVTGNTDRFWFSKKEKDILIQNEDGATDTEAVIKVIAKANGKSAECTVKIPKLEKPCTAGTDTYSWSLPTLPTSSTECAVITPEKYRATLKYGLCQTKSDGSGTSYTYTDITVTPKVDKPTSGGQYSLTWSHEVNPPSGKHTISTKVPTSGYNACKIPTPPKANISCIYSGSPTAIFDGTKIKQGTTIVCSAPGAKIYCSGQGYNTGSSGAVEGQKSCTAKFDTGTLQFKTVANDKWSEAVVSFPSQPIAKITCNYKEKDALGRMWYTCDTTPNAAGGGLLNKDNSGTWDKGPKDYTVGGAVCNTGCTSTIRGKANGYNDPASVTICKFPSGNCSEGEKGNVMCSGTAWKKTCTASAPSWEWTQEVGMADMSKCNGVAATKEESLARMSAPTVSECGKKYGVHYLAKEDNKCRWINVKVACKYSWQ